MLLRMACIGAVCLLLKSQNATAVNWGEQVRTSTVGLGSLPCMLRSLLGSIDIIVLGCCLSIISLLLCISALSSMLSTIVKVVLELLRLRSLAFRVAA